MGLQLLTEAWDLAKFIERVDLDIDLEVEAGQEAKKKKGFS